MRGLIVLMTLAIIGTISLTTISAYADTFEHTITGNNMPLMLEVKQSDKLHFTGDPSGVKGFEAIDKNHTWFNCQSGWNADEYAVCVIDFSDFELGYHEWVDRTTEITGKFYVEASEQVVASSSSDTSYESVSEQAKNFKSQIEQKIQDRISPLEAEIASLKAELSSTTDELTVAKQTLVTVQSDLESANTSLVTAQSEIDTLSSTSATLEQHKKDAQNWKAVALEQLKVMTDILGLF
jgi:hypothetical protein